MLHVINLGFFEKNPGILQSYAELSE